MSNLIEGADKASELIAAGEAVLVDFWAEWCGPCRMLSPVLEKLSVEPGAPKIVKVNVDIDHAFSQEHGVASVPTIKLFRGGSEVDTHIGAVPLPVLKKFVGIA